MIRSMRRRNPDLGVAELWARMRRLDYTHYVESRGGYCGERVWKQRKSQKKKYQPKPYEQIQYTGRRVQSDVKVAPLACIADPEQHLFQYTAIDEYSRYRILSAYTEQSIGNSNIKR